MTKLHGSAVRPENQIVLDTDHDGVVTTEELMAALQKLKHPVPPEKVVDAGETEK